MKYILITKNDTQEIISEVEYKSIRQIAIALNTTYCSCYENFLMHYENRSPPKKLSQVRFNKKYKIMIRD
jgi:hypothetical protein